jgi:hypothetical protein
MLINCESARDYLIPTTEFNGREVGYRRQRLTVVRGRRVVHGPYFPNTDIVGDVIARGKRGAEYRCFVHKSGHASVLYAIETV